MYIDYRDTDGGINDREYNSLPEENNEEPWSPYITTLKITSLLLLCTSLGLGYGVYHRYEKSLDWSTNRDSLKMANMPIDTLTDSGKQLKYKENFLVLYDKMYHSDGTITASDKQMKQLALQLSKIKRGKPIYQAKYNRINEKFVMTKKLDSIFADKKHTIIREDMSPNKIRQIMKSDLSPHLNSLHRKNSKDQFVKNQLREIHKLYADTELILQITDQTLQISQLNVKKHRIMFHDNVVESTYDNIVKKYNNLNYKWRYLDSYLAMSDEIQQVLSKQEDKISRYNDYVQDQKDKQNAYEDLRKMHLNRQEAYEAKIREKREEEEQKRREAEEAKEEQKRQAEMDSSSSTDDDSSEDTKKHKSDNSSDSNNSSSRYHQSDVVQHNRSTETSEKNSGSNNSKQANGVDNNVKRSNKVAKHKNESQDTDEDDLKPVTPNNDINGDSDDE